jgi:hypothetical protein
MRDPRSATSGASSEKRMRAVGQHHVRFSPELWAKWLKRFNEAPNWQLIAGIEELRTQLARRERKRR